MGLSLQFKSSFFFFFIFFFIFKMKGPTSQISRSTKNYPRTSPWIVKVLTTLSSALVLTNMANGGLFGFNEDEIGKLYKKVICRKNEIDALLTLFGKRETYTCPAIFICGHIGTGKSFVVQILLKDLEVSAKVSLGRNPRLIFAKKEKRFVMMSSVS